MEVILPKSAKWKSVKLSGSLEKSSGQEGLLGIETLSNYSLVKKKGKKRKIETLNQDLTSKTEKDEVNQSKKQKKKKRKKKRNAVVKKVNAEDETDDKDNASQEFASKENEKIDINAKDCSNTEELADMTPWRDIFAPEPVLRALHDLGFIEPTPIQKAIMPAAVKGHMDVVGAAETGSGKTLAFGIPIVAGILGDIEREKKGPLPDEQRELFDDDEFEDLSDSENQGSGCVKVINNVDFDFETDENDEEKEIFAPPPEFFEDIERRIQKKLRALVLTPTRELALQVKNHIEAICKYTDIKVAVIFGGMAPQKQTRMLSYCPQIVVATPGRLWDLIQEGNDHLSNVKSIKYLAIDETDRMVEKGHFEEVQKLLELLNEDEKYREKRQNFIFSATLALVHDVPKYGVVKKKGKQMKKLTAEDKLNQVISMIGVKKRYKRVDLTKKYGTVETLTESKIHAELTEKDFYLYYFTQVHPGRTLVFCNSIDCVRRLVNLFSLLDCNPLGLHAQMHQKQRLKNLERFSADSKGLLIATDVAARGLDIKDIEHVVHYQVPRTSENYVHRSGRTARSFKEGLSVMLIDSSENNNYRKMCKTLNRDKDLPLFPIEQKYLTRIKQRVQVARELDKLKLQLRKENASASWWKKAAEEAEIELSDNDSDDDEDENNKAKQKSYLKRKVFLKEQELRQMLSIPLIAHGFSGKYPTKSGKLDLPDTLSTKPSKSALESLANGTSKAKESMNNNVKKKTKAKKRKKKQES